MSRVGNNLVVDSGFDGWIIPRGAGAPVGPSPVEWYISATGKLVFAGSAEFNTDYGVSPLLGQTLCPYQKMTLVDGQPYQVTYVFGRECGPDDYCAIRLGYASGVLRGSAHEGGAYEETIVASVREGHPEDLCVWIQPYVEDSTATFEYDQIIIRPILTDDQTGQVGAIAEQIVAILAALEYDGAKVFKTVDRWKHQLTFQKGGFADYGKYAPFAFVGYEQTEMGREGGFDLRQNINMAILIGVENKSAGAACWGDDRHLGTSKIRELVIEALDKKHPDGGLETDVMEYDGDEEWLDNETQNGIRLHFVVPTMAVKLDTD